MQGHDSVDAPGSASSSSIPASVDFAQLYSGGPARPRRRFCAATSASGAATRAVRFEGRVIPSTSSIKRSSASLAPCESRANQFASLGRHLRSSDAFGATHDTLETYVIEETREIARDMMQGHLELRAAAERPVRVMGKRRRGSGRATKLVASAALAGWRCDRSPLDLPGLRCRWSLSAGRCAIVAERLILHGKVGERAEDVARAARGRREVEPQARPPQLATGW